MKKIIILLFIITFANPVCNGQISNRKISNEIDANILLKQLKLISDPIKGEFETTEEFKKRIAAFHQDTTTYYFEVQGNDAKYNADSEKMTFYIGEFELSYKRDSTKIHYFQWLTTSSNGVGTVETKTNDGKYTVKAGTLELNIYKFLFENFDNFKTHIGKRDTSYGADDCLMLDIKIPLAEAKELKENYKVIMAIKPVNKSLPGQGIQETGIIRPRITDKVLNVITLNTNIILCRLVDVFIVDKRTDKEYRAH